LFERVLTKAMPLSLAYYFDPFVCPLKNFELKA